MTAPRGAYGLRLEGFDSTVDVLPVVPTAWPLVELHREAAGERRPPDRRLDHHTATIPFHGGAWAALDRAARTARIIGPSPIGDDEVVHPLLSPIASVFARWDGHEALHAGAVVGRDGAWAICGPRGAGKSTALAALAMAGLPLVADDLLVVDGSDVFAGPRSIDLRPGTAGWLDAGERVREVRGGARQRLIAPGAAASTPLCGILHLEWSGESRIKPLGLTERAQRLAPNRASGLEEAAPQRSLALFALPAWGVSRPHDGALPDTVARIVDLIG
jgi:hypothetical protein